MKMGKRVLGISLVLVLLLSTVLFSETFATETIEYQVGDIVRFGSYPQSKVTENVLTYTLNNLAPDWTDWISYGYYSSTTNATMVSGDWMRYTDVTYCGSKYRGVSFTHYRPYHTRNSSSYTYQDVNGYSTETTYWFKFEPIDWRVLDPNTGLVVCESIIDSQPYSNTAHVDSSAEYTYRYFIHSSSTVYANDYEASSIRKWLNNDFYNTAFSENQKNEISITTLNNDGYYTLIGTSGYEKLDSNKTEDKIFLLSYNDVINSSYGFNSDVDVYDDARIVQSSDYAKCQGLRVYESSGSSSWFLRTPGVDSYHSCYIDVLGAVGCDSTYYNVCRSDIGVRPALRFNKIVNIHRHDYLSEITIPATHLKEGVKTFTCKCGDEYTESIAKIEAHTYKEVVTAPTCIAQGYTTYICECGDYCYKNYVDKLGHDMSSYEETTKPTCTKLGLETSYCSRCNYIETRNIAMLDHLYRETEVFPTCNSQGYTTYTCECGDSYIDDYTDMLKHEYASEITTPATHLTEGVKTFICNCGDTYTEVIDKLATHTYTSVITKEPTHLEEGVRTYTCECTDSYTESLPTLTEHSYEKTITNPTCTSQGYTTYTCECGDTYTDDYTDENGHSFTNYISDGKANCTTDGSKIAKCNNCDATDSIPEIGGHDFSDEWTIDIEPTCTAEGSKSHHCKNCIEKEDVTPMGKLAHTYTKVTIEPSCAEKGYNVYTCVCGDTYTETIDPTGHDFDGSKCKNCDYDKATDCSCNCHKSGISGFFWKIINFFNKLFKSKQFCACGAKHW